MKVNAEPLSLPQFGDSAEITYWPSLDYPRLLLSVACDLGGKDELHGGGGDVDYLVGSAHNDTIWGDGGVDVVFGDHARIELSGTESFQLLYAVTIDASCEGGDDIIDLGEDDDLVRKIFNRSHFLCRVESHGIVFFVFLKTRHSVVLTST